MGLGLGLGIWWPIQTSIIPGILRPLKARATYFENVRCTTATLQKIENIQYTAPAAPAGFLADYPGASVAYSLRNLIDTTPNVVRVRRSSDNTEQDFTATEITDGTLTTFTGVNDGFVTTWYDQSGNSNNAAQAAAANQPKLVSSGVVELDNGKPCLNYDTSGNDNFDLATPISNARTVFQTLNFKGVGGNFTQFLLGSSAESLNDYNSGTNGKILSNQYAASYVLNGSNSINGFTQDLANTSKGGLSSLILVTMLHTASSGQFNKIAQDRSRTGRSIRGSLAELIVYPTDQSANITQIQTNIMANHGNIGTVGFGEASEGNSLTLSAPLGKVFATVEFASYGNPSGTNGNYTVGSCNASSSQTIVEGYLLGNTGEITIPATNAVFGDPCSGTGKKLAVKATFS